MPTQEPIYLIDGSAYIYRAYHAISPLTNASGLPTHAIFGFVNILRRVIREKNPRYLAIAFDARGPNFRHELYREYKANRPPMPDDLACQLPYIKEISRAYSLVTFEQQGVEADDLIASAVARLRQHGHPVVVVSGDKDLLQLVSEQVTLWDPMNDKRMDPAGVVKKYQVGPEKLTDLFALIGDSSDNVPGVAGVGPKTAEKLINEYGSLDDLYARLDTVPQKKLREKLAEHKKLALLSRDLIRLKEDLPLPGDLAAYAIPAPDEEKLRELFTFLGFTRLIKSELTAAKVEAGGFRLVQDEKELTALVAALGRSETITLDTETTSLDPLTADLVGISLCTDSKNAYYLPVGHRHEDGTLQPGQFPPATVLQALRPLFTGPQLKLGHNLKFDYQVLAHHGLTLSPPLADTMIASYLLDPSRRSHKLDDLCEEFLERRTTTFAEVTTGDKREDAFAYVSLPAARDYSCEDAAVTCMLWEKFRPELEALGLGELFADLEMALLPLLARMEQVGIRVDPGQLADLSREFSAELTRLERRIYDLAGGAFNINSPRQLGEILFERLGLPHGKKTKTGYSTDSSVLEELARYHDLPATVMAHRNLTKLKSTYVDKLAELIHPETGRIHTSFNQTVTATGRLSSSNPNLQNIPIRTKEGQRIRAAFIAAPGHRFLSADYSQIDLRVLAHYSQDQALLAAFRAGEDIHSRTAAEIFRVNPALITKEMRRVAKTINFGIVYGMSAFGLASQLNLSRKEAGIFIERYFAHYQGVKRFMEEIVAQARKNGFVTTLLNRRRLLPEINSSNKIRREFAERTAINTPIQGTAADIIKLATLACDRELQKARLKAELLLQIHDELVFEVPEKEVDKTSGVVKKAMESVLALAVPLTVNLATGHNLAEV
ncbi:MAG: DNA polymerase I [Thermodesulfobacteriota bacterium]